MIAYLVSIISFGLVLYLEDLKLRRDQLSDSEGRPQLSIRIQRLESIWPSASLLVMVLLSAGSWLLL